jgi:hypothetical protein
MFGICAKYARRTFVIKNQTNARFLERTPERRHIIRNWRTLASLEILHGTEGHARAFRELALGPSKPSPRGPSLGRGKALFGHGFCRMATKILDSLFVTYYILDHVLCVAP